MEQEGDGEWPNGYHVTTRWEPAVGRWIAEVTFPMEVGAVGFDEREAKQNLSDKIRALMPTLLGS